MEEWAEEIRKDAEEVNVSEYQRNRKRQNALISYAAPYRLNVETTATYNYRLTLTDPTTLQTCIADIPRAAVDNHMNPERVLRGYIDQLKKQLAPPVYTAAPTQLTDETVSKLHKYAEPFTLTINIYPRPVGISTTVELTINHADYGFVADQVVVPLGDEQEILRKCQLSIDKKRKELGWKPEEKPVAQPIKPFVLECPEHGGAMSKVVDELNHEEYFVCLVPGCKKKARQKNHVQSGGFGPPPSDGLQGEVPPKKTKQNITIDYPVSDDYYAPINDPSIPWGNYGRK